MSETATPPEVAAARVPRRRNLAAGLAALGAGALVAAALPPWGWWPLAIVGVAVLDRLVAGRPRRSRAARCFLFGLGWYLPGMGWMWFLSAPGWLAACAVYAGYLALAGALVPPGPGRRPALAGAIVLAEALRFVWPFGGVPLASLAIGQAAGPLVAVAAVGGPLLVSLVTLLAGLAVSAATERHWRAGAALAVPVVVLVLAAPLADRTRTVGALDVAYVQGGGPQGTHAIHTDHRQVVERHLAATAALEPGPQVVVWPENVVDVPDFASSRERTEIAAQAARLGAPIAVGITEDAQGGQRFVNAQVVVQPDGSITDRYEKVQRVPFGEYMPLRSLLTALGAPTGLVPRDAVSGQGPAVIEAAGTPLATAISWEIFFAPRVRDGVRNGGQVILNPTNGSSYTGTVLQTQQLASSHLRAVETGRWVVQVAPTGFSAFVTPGGAVLDRSEIGQAHVARRVVERRDGRTLAVVLGDLPVVFAAAALLTAGSLYGARRRNGAPTAAPPVAPPGEESAQPG